MQFFKLFRGFHKLNICNKSILSRRIEILVNNVETAYSINQSDMKESLLSKRKMG